MTITQILYFLKVSEEKSFTRAADKLYVSQQAVSKQIRLLEQELSVRLITRESHRFELTPEGEAFYELWKRQIEETSALIAMSRGGLNRREVLRIGIADLNQIVDTILPALLELREQENGYRIECRVGSLRAIADELIAGTLDAAITLESDMPKDLTGFPFVTLDQLTPEIFVGKGHPLYNYEIDGPEAFRSALQQCRKKRGPSDPPADTFLTMDRFFSSRFSDLTMSVLDSLGVRPSLIRTFTNPDEMEMELITGRGILISYRIFLHARYLSSLRVFPVGASSAAGRETSLILVWRESVAREFIDQLMPRLF